MTTHPMLLPFHPAADLFPMLDVAELSELADDIRQRGLLEPVWVCEHEGRTTILDGRNRVHACALAGVEPTVRKYEGPDPVAFSLSQNLRRRHLTPGQRAMLALEVEKMYAAQADKGGRPPGATTVPGQDALDEAMPPGAPPAPPAQRKPVADLPQVPRRAPLSRDKAARVVQSSGRGVQQAKRVAEKAPDLAEKVRAGTLALDRAEKLVKKREAQRHHEQAVAAAAELPPVADLRHGDFRTSLDDLTGTVDAIITDPPYPTEFIPLLSDLSRVAARVLKPGGICAVMIGQYHLPEVYRRLTEHLDYHWTLAYLTPGGQAVQVWPKKVNTFWKPVITLTNGPRDSRWLGDVAKSETNDNDKRYHHWGQSESGMADLVKRLTEPGATILDPFLGAGTTGVVALTLGREFIGCDTDAKCVADADARMKQVRR